MSITVENLTLRYRGTTRPVLTDLGLDVRNGEFLTLLGPSGSGKSTLLRCIAGLERPEQGCIRLDGETVFDSRTRQWVKPERRRLGMVFQSYAVWPHMSVAQNIGYPLRIERLPRAEIAARVAEVAQMVGLGDFLDRPAPQLSGGQQQRVALARALVMRPRAILFDEPLSNLDAKLREHMRQELRGLQRKTGVTAIYVTHDQVEAFALSDRIAVMEAGVICQVGTPTEVYHAPASPYVADFLGAANLVEGRLCQDASGRRVELLGHSLPLGAPAPGGAALPDGAPVRVAIRPEHLSLAEPGAAGSLAGSVRLVEFLGSLQMLGVEVGGSVLRVQMPAAVPAPAEGARVGLAVAPGQIRIFPASRSLS
ncbi:MAG: ABC transporter ATP-binding protein [Alphaproteobacteria bacterium]|nr:ABC transporter ATP-binding protein [Alphaproteobacteria bacterium]